MRNTAILDGIRNFMPDWAPDNLSMYVAHVNLGLSMREIARQLNVQPSTVSRNLKTIERKCNDPLFKSGLDRVAKAAQSNFQASYLLWDSDKPLPSRSEQVLETDNYRRESAQTLKMLKGNRSHLIVSIDLKTAVLSKRVSECEAEDVMSVDPQLVETLALQDFLKLKRLKKVLIYSITSTAERRLERREEIKTLKRQYLTTHSIAPKHSVQASQRLDPLHSNIFQNAHKYDTITGDTPLLALARLRDKSGNMFLTQDQIQAGQKLREDFELAKVFLASQGDTTSDRGASNKMRLVLGWNPHKRLTNALDFIGPILSDVAMRCCCHLQGMEQIEEELEWSARSGKIVVRIALTQLTAFYINEKSNSTAQIDYA